MQIQTLFYPQRQSFLVREAKEGAPNGPAETAGAELSGVIRYGDVTSGTFHLFRFQFLLLDGQSVRVTSGDGGPRDAVQWFIGDAERGGAEKDLLDILPPSQIVRVDERIHGGCDFGRQESLQRFLPSIFRLFLDPILDLSAVAKDGCASKRGEW